MFKISEEALLALPPEEQAIVLEQLAELAEIYERDPLQAFWPHCRQQLEFFTANTRTVAAFAGTQAGKTTSLVVNALIQVSPRELLPERLQPFKRFDGQVFGRVVNPGAKQLESVLLPAFRKWCPKHLLRNGSFAKSWEKQSQVLRFADGSFIDFLTYETDLDKFGGPQRHFLGYDEPPPRNIRDEGLGRLVRYGGFEMFAMTPLKTNTGWIRRDIWRKREHPDITVCKWSIHDNTTLSPEAVQYFLDSLPNDLWRRAREVGDFVDVGGLMYPGFEDWVLEEPVKPSQLRGLDIVVGIDPGLRNAGFSWHAFDRENGQLMFDEAILQQKLPRDYAELIRATNRKWGIAESQVTYVIDPAYRVRSLVDAENVESALAREGIYCVPAQNQVEAGVMQLRQRGEHGMFKVSPDCLIVRDEADEYAMEDREDGKFVEVRNDHSHVLDTVRYVSMHRAWDPAMESQSSQGRLGWEPGRALTAFELTQSRSVPTGPMGDMA